MTFALLPLLLVLLSSCSRMGTQFASQSTQTLQEVAAAEQWPALPGSVQPTNLYSLLQSPELQQLTAEALAANPGLQQTKLSLEILQAQQRQTFGDRLPQLDAAPAVAKAEGDGTSYNGSLALSWELDIWGKLADESKGAQLDVLEQTWLLQNSRNILTAEVMQAWLTLIADSHAISIQNRRLATLIQNERFILERYRNGLGTLEDLDSARSTVASARATLTGYREDLAREKRALRVLLGRTSAFTENVPTDYPVVLVPLAELPEQTLARRPDLQAAYNAVAATDVRSKVAYKDMLPSISLSAALDDIGDSASSLFLAGPVWSLLGQLTAPLYHGGSLKAAAEIAELTSAQQYEVYRETLLSAVQEVEDCLGSEKELSQRIDHITTALNNAQNSLETYKKSYRTGLVDIIELLTVQKQTYDLEAQLDNLNYERLVNRIDLGLALGLGVPQQ